MKAHFGRDRISALVLILGSGTVAVPTGLVATALSKARDQEVGQG